MNSYTDLEKLELYARQIHDSGIDITSDQKQWTELAYVCASQGEAGREPFHLISSNYPEYSREECDKHFGYCLKTSKNSLSLGTLVKIARDHGLEPKLPRGRRPMTKEQKEEQAKSKMATIIDMLMQTLCWRYNQMKDNVEISTDGALWADFTDRVFDTLISKIRMEGISISDSALKSLVNSELVSHDYNPVEDYLSHLPAWNPDTDPDYIRETFVGHMTFQDPDKTEFYDMVFRLFMVGMVALWKRLVVENPTMPVVSGPQGLGKTYFGRGLVPPELESYVTTIGPNDKYDKDEKLKFSEKLLIVCEEFELDSKSKSDTLKYLLSMDKSTVRRSYDRYSKDRPRIASLFGTTNESSFIYSSEGNRRFVGIEIADMVKLCDKPLNHAGLYAQTLYLLNHGYGPHPDKEQMMAIVEHNRRFLRLSDCEEVLKTFVREPEEGETAIALTAGDLLRELTQQGFRGPAFNSNNIGKAMKHIGIEPKKTKRGMTYKIVKADFDRMRREQIEDAIDESEVPF